MSSLTPCSPPAPQRSRKGRGMELKPCPFCGSPAEDRLDESGDYHNTREVGCFAAWEKCFAPKDWYPIRSWDTEQTKRAEAYTRWNARITPQPA
jgi:hypothetical protein